MDPFVAAMLAALSTAAVNLADEMVKDAYQGLKTVLKKRFAADDVAVATVTSFEKQPERNKQILQGCLEGTDLSKDAEVNKKLDTLSTTIEQRVKTGDITVKMTVLDTLRAYTVGAQLKNAEVLGDRGLDIDMEVRGSHGSTTVGLQLGDFDAPVDNKDDLE